MSTQLTPSQEKVLSHNRHLAVIANAGSGKTHVLVQRYLDVLEEVPSLAPSNIVAITFTRNAAAELLTRISTKLEERIAESDGRRLARLLHIRDHLTGAAITTIDGFAKRILSAYPIEAGVDARFGVIEQTDLGILTSDCIRRTFYSVLDSAYAKQNDPPMLELFRTYGRKALEESIAKMVVSIDKVEKIRAMFETTDDALIERWYHAIETSLSWTTSEETIAVIEQVSNHLLKTKYGQTASGECAKFLKTPTPLQFVLTCNSIFTKDYARIRTGAVDLEGLAYDVKDLDALQEKAKRFMPMLTAIAEWSVQFRSQLIEQVPLLRATMRLYDSVLDAIEDSLRSVGQVDFQRLLVLLRKILQMEHVQQELAAQYPVVMIDEFQDTNSLQFEIATLLTKHLAATSNMMVVGDPKQSIYQFREADPRIFSEMCQLIRQQRLSPLAIKACEGFTKDEQQGIISLRESFRMSRAPLAFINLLFHRLEMQDYQALVQGYSGPVAGSVTFACIVKDDKRKEQNRASDGGDEATDESIDADEGEYVAKKILQAVGKLEVEESGAIRPARFGDIAILVRKTTALGGLERALLAHHIPFVSAGAHDFYQQQEILDILSYIKFLSDPSDDIALIGVLRSPYCCISDQELYQIAHYTGAADTTTGTQSFWQRVLAFPSDRRSRQLHKAIEEIESLQPLAGRTSPAFLIERIYALSGIVAIVGQGDRGDLRVANLEKFLEIARDAEKVGIPTLYHLTERIDYLIAHDDRESQANLAAGHDVVQIMTIHGAKGLEFPIVVLPLLAQEGANFDSRVLDEQFGILLPSPDTQPSLRSLAKVEWKQANDAESLRLLYVAVTRAKHHLILSGTAPESKPKGWLKQITTVMPQLISPGMPVIASDVEQYHSESRLTTTERYELTIQVESADIDVPELEASEAELPAPTYDFQLERLQVAKPAIQFSASQYLMMRECPLEYYLRYTLGLPEEAPAWLPDQASNSSTLEGRTVGRFVHSIFEHSAEILHDDALDETRFREISEASASQLEITDAAQFAELQQIGRKHLMSLAKSELFQRFDHATTSFSEYELELRMESGDILFGILDRVLQLPNGQWEIIDFKTDVLTAANRKSKITRYRQQLLFYSNLLRSQRDLHYVRASLFFSASGEIVTFEFAENDFSTLHREINSLLRLAHQNEAAEDLLDIPRNAEHCVRCRYYDQASKQCIVLAANQNATSSPAR